MLRTMTKNTANIILAASLALALVSFEARTIYTGAAVSGDALDISSEEAEEILSRLAPDAGLIGRLAQAVARRPSPQATLSKYDQFIQAVAARNGVSPALVKAVIHAESGFDPYAVSPKGAIGLMQVMPSTADLVGIDNPFNPQENIQAGVKYLKGLLKMFDGNEHLAVAAYNTGPGKVKRYGGVPPYKETKTYVERVMMYYRIYLNS